MGGGIGKSVIAHIRTAFSEVEITAAGTNAIATAAMLKAGASHGATGENAIVYNCTKADYIIGAIGIVIANSMYGEISPRMAEAVSSSAAHKILIPMDNCATVLGVAEKPLQAYINEIAETIKKLH